MVDTRKAVAHLKQADPVMRRLIEEIGPYRQERVRNRFGALVVSILHQQLALKAAQTITLRFLQLYGNGRGRMPTPAELLATPPRKLRRAGLSRQKIRYLKHLSRKVHGGTVPLSRLARLSDEEVIEVLTEVKGIGCWTAEMFLLFSLGRPDVWAVDDLGLQLAVKQNYRLRKHPSAEKMRRLAQLWRPYRSVASWYLWQSRRRVIGAAPISPVKG